MKKTFFRRIKLAAIICLLLISPSCVFADDGVSLPQPNAEPPRNQNITVFDSENGMISKEIKDDGITWMSERSIDKSYLIGLDNSSEVIPPGSRLQLTVISRDENPGEFDDYMELADSKTKRKLQDGQTVFFLKIVSPDGTEFDMPQTDVPLYVQLPDDFDPDDVMSMFLCEGADEPIHVEMKELESPEGKYKFAKLTLHHFGGPVVVGEKASFTGSIFGDADPVILCVCAAAAVIALIILIVVKKRKES